jgi:ATPase family associated with various cellular activities (AAA)
MRKISQKTLCNKATKLCKFIEEINEFNDEPFSDADNTRIRFVKNFFGLKHTFDVIILLMFVEKKLTNDSSLTLNQIVNQFKIDLPGCIQLNTTLQYLIKRRFIVACERGYRNGMDYSLSQTCLTAILQYNKELIQIRKADSFEGFLQEMNAISKGIGQYDDEFMDRITELIDEYVITNEIQWLRQQKLSESDEVILCMAMRSHILERESFDLEDAIRFFSTDKFYQYQKEKEFISGKNRLLTEGLLNFESDNFMNINRLKLSDKSIQGMCSTMERIKNDVFHPTMFKLTDPNTNDEKYLHSNPDLRLIEKMVSQDNYEKIKSKVPRLSILLIGAPGVGKTSFINHLAKISGRPILSANISQILGCYVGESEKNLISLFLEAEMAFEYFEVTPLIVFDEAEALLYSRTARSTNSVSKMNNNIISLLLASLDKFKGILICCSNFSFKNGSFDPALHRRFHMVSEIAAPPKKVLKSIFQNHFPEFSDEQSVSFIEKHPLITPAQIRNIKDKYEVHSMLGEVRNPMDTVSRFAEQDLESLKNRKRKIGFSQNKLTV